MEPGLELFLFQEEGIRFACEPSRPAPPARRSSRQRSESPPGSARGKRPANTLTTSVQGDCRRFQEKR